MKRVVFLIFTLVAFIALPITAQVINSSQMKVNFKSLVSRADLDYTVPVVRSEEGIPVGNGHMGTLVWTTPSAMHYQINRADLFSVGNNTNSYPKGHTDYSNGCGFVDINFVDWGEDLFTDKNFNQHLSVYDGLASVKGNGVSSRAIVWNDKDVLVTEIDDQRDNPSSINIDLRMLRFGNEYVAKKNWELTSRNAAEIQTGYHNALSRLEIRNGKIILVQEYREANFFSSSAVAIGISGRQSKASCLNQFTVRLSAEPQKGKFVIFTACATSYDPKEDVAGLAVKEMDAAISKSFDELLGINRTWWSNYWSKAFVRLHSADGVADYVEINNTYLLYIMASCSRDEYMPRFSGMLWLTNADMCMWGSQYWWHNQGCYYEGLTPANRPEIVEPVYTTYSKEIASYSMAASQQWGTKGLWIPETTWFNGLEVLPDSIAAEMRDLYLARKPWEAASKKFMDYAKNKNGLNSRWNWQFLANKKGPFAWTSHIMSTTAKVSYMYWLRYAYYLDKEWLKTTGYSMIKGTVEFYRNFPNLYKAPDGKYHIRFINNLESNWGGSDTPEEILAMHEMIPIAIRASEILGVDADLRPLWKELHDNLIPVPSSVEPASYYDLCTIGTDDKQLFDNVLAAFNKRNANVNENARVSVLSRGAVAAANLGLADKIKFMIPSQIRSYKEDNCDIPGSGETGLGVLRNRLMLREGPGAIECERLGLASQALNLALLQSVPPSPGGKPVNYIFPAWPKDWDAQFTLAARNAFLISASIEKGEIEFVEIFSQKGGPCQVKNPWPASDVTLYRDGKKANNIAGSLLVITSNAGETIAIVPKGKQLKIKEVM